MALEDQLRGRAPSQTLAVTADSLRPLGPALRRRHHRVGVLVQEGLLAVDEVHVLLEFLCSKESDSNRKWQLTVLFEHVSNVHMVVEVFRLLLDRVGRLDRAQACEELQVVLRYATL